MKKYFFELVLFTFILLILGYAGIRHNTDMLGNILLSFVFIGATIIPGWAILNTKYFNRYSVFEKFVFSFGFSIAIYAVLSVIAFTSLFDHSQIFSIIAFVILNILSVLYILKTRSYRLFIREKLIRQTLAVVLLFVIFCQIFIRLPFQMPASLPDGPYVFKNPNNLHIKIQRLTDDLPADNYLPFVYSEFLQRGVSFTQNRPMLPGQEVSSRTVLMGLETSYFSNMIYHQAPLPPVLGKFEYVGTMWPDVTTFGNDNKGFKIFLDIAIVLNAIFFFALVLFFMKLFTARKALGASILFLLLPYALSETIFTWPKFLMAYFVILTLYLAISKKGLLLMAVFAALAYHSHPSGLIYVLFIMLYVAIKNAGDISKFHINKPLSQLKYLLRTKRLFLKRLVFMSILFLICISPWIIWTEFIVKIPSNLISQNLANGTGGLTSQLQTRLDNIGDLLFSWRPYGGTLLSQLTSYQLFSFTGSIGLLFFAGYYYLSIYFKKFWLEIILLAVLPLIFLTLPWGNFMGSIAVLFSQPAIPLFFCFTLILLSRNKIITNILILIQFVFSFLVIWYGMYHLNEQIALHTVSIAYLVMLFGIQILFGMIGIYYINDADSRTEKMQQRITRFVHKFPFVYNPR